MTRARRLLLLPCAAALLAAWASGCVTSHDLDPAMDGGPRVDGSTPGEDTGSADGGGVIPPRPRHPGGEAVVFCGAETCGLGSECCRPTLRCHDPAVPSSCPVPPREERPLACASNAHCAASEYCHTIGCAGTGDCVERPTAARCAAEEDPAPACGCDGVDQPSECWAHHAGVIVVGVGSCGGAEDDRSVASCDPTDPTTCDLTPGTECRPSDEDPRAPYACEWIDPPILCTRDDHCPTGRTCCEPFGRCVSVEADAYCAVADGGVPCVTSADCESFANFHGLSNVYCGGEGCSGGGACRVPGGSCGGELEPVCGCDGVEYQNECEAHRAGVRIASAGTCG